MTRITPSRCCRRSSGSSGPGALVALAIFVLGVSGPVEAQALRGRIVEAGTARPIPGALLLLIGAADTAALARTMTNDVGRFELLAPRTGTYRVRVLRIGQQGWTSAGVDLPAAGRVVELQAPALPFTLPEISVTEKSHCAAGPPGSRAAGPLFEEAWKAFALTEETLRRSEFLFEVQLTYRATDRHGTLTSERGARKVGRGSWPVRSVSPESLEASGFVQPRDTLDGPVYFGPDAQVLFSEPFLRTHCFRPAQATGGELVGLAFEPVKNRKLPDIEGVMWLDPLSAELRRLEYRYTRLWSWVPEGSAGGELAFERLANGAWVVSRWSLRAPLPETRPRPFGEHPGPTESERRFFGGGRVSFYGMREESGTVLLVRASEGDTLWRPLP